MSIELKLPDVGDNIEQGIIVAILIKVGEQIEEGQTILELETDKAVIEVPASQSGTVENIAVQEGDNLAVGATILTLSADSSASATDTAEDTDEQSATTQPTPAPAATQPAQPTQSAPHTQPAPPAKGIHAAPSVRRLAREMGIDLHRVQGSGIAGRISKEDVEAQSAGHTGGHVASSAAQAVQSAPPLPDFGKWGNIRREDMSGIRKATVRSMTHAWTSVPMVTHFDKADITLMEQTRKRFGDRVQQAGGKLTMTHILMKVVAGALRQFPKFNASLDVAAEQVIFKEYINIGVAVDTPVGLLVPVVPDADRKNITELVLELSELAQKARDRKLKPDEMQGATFTISNLGGIGGHAFTPIVNSPEVAILGVSRGGIEPVWNKETETFEPRQMLPLSLSYDHRLIDGADAARFLRYICQNLAEPFLISL